MGNSGSSSANSNAPRKNGQNVLNNLMGGVGILRVGPMFRSQTSLTVEGRKTFPLKPLVEKMIADDDLECCIKYELGTSQLAASFGSTLSQRRYRSVCASYNLPSMRFFREAYINNEFYCIEGTDVVYRDTGNGIPGAHFRDVLAHERQGLTSLETLAKEAAGVVKIAIPPDKRAAKDALILPENKLWTIGYVLAILWVVTTDEQLAPPKQAQQQSAMGDDASQQAQQPQSGSDQQAAPPPYM